jgi:CII-binding regulator of phage lambda lysogenization HflD
MAKRKDKQRSTRHYTEKKRSSNLQIYSVSSMFISYKYTNDKQTINKLDIKISKLSCQEGHV